MAEPKMKKWPLMFVLLALFVLASVVVLAFYLAVLTDQLNDEVTLLSKHIDSLKSRVQDLEIENDYLFEDQGQEENTNAQELVATTIQKPDLCFLSFDPGPCGSRIARWFYNHDLADCMEFPWSGCRGNENNFLTLKQCRAACHVNLRKPTPPADHNSISYSNRMTPEPREKESSFDPVACTLPPDAGPCKSRIPRFYHSNGKCLKFAYGGCGGNQNNFFTMNDCMDKCLTSATPSSLVKECDLPPESGDCKSRKRRFYYDKEAKQCQEFIYSGCGGNGNNFVKIDKCRAKCMPLQ